MVLHLRGLPSLRPLQAIPLLVVFTVLAVVLFRRDFGLIIWRPQKPYIPSTYDWAHHVPKYPVRVADMVKLPAGTPPRLPRVQYDFAREQTVSPERDAKRIARKAEVEASFRKAWGNYEKFAWGADELRPISAAAAEKFNGWGATLVDGLDTLWIMGMKPEFDRAVGVVAKLDWNKVTQGSLNLFETNIRYLGGLVAAYDLSHEKVLLRKAVELGDMLYAAFDNDWHLPNGHPTWDELKAGGVMPLESQSIAGIGTLSLEFTRLAQLTGNNKYYDAIDRIKSAFERTQDQMALPGLWPTDVNARDEFKPRSNYYHLGGAADSAYEYFPKMHALLGGLDPAYEKMYKKVVDGARSHLLYRPMLPGGDDVLMFGAAVVNETDQSVEFVANLEHLTCYTGGMLLLGGKLFEEKSHVEIGEKVARGCVSAYSITPSGIMPDTAQFIRCNSTVACEWDEELWKTLREEGLPKGIVKSRNRQYKLRPEAIESVFILYRVTGQPELLDVAWDMWSAIKKASETEYAFAQVADTTVADSPQDDEMESYFFAETLKYFYLMFDDPNHISLDEWVLNTEAHPFRRPVSR